MFAIRITRLSFCMLCSSMMPYFVLNDSVNGQQSLTLAPGASVIQNETPRKFLELLDKQDFRHFRGYKQITPGAGWSIENDVLHLADSKGKYGGGGGDLVTLSAYTDFELQFEFKVPPGGSTGLLYRVALGDREAYFSGIEFQLVDDAGHKDGKVENTSSGAIYGMYAPKSKQPRAAGIWNSASIIVQGNQITHYLNDVKIVEAEIGSPDWVARLAESRFKDSDKFAKSPNGHIVFQDHGDEAWFRKIRIKDLGNTTLPSE